jgi:4a-hydroxytetrahydrobiopterin dehydratase
MGVGTKSTEARIWAAAIKFARDDKLQFPEKQEQIESYASLHLKVVPDWSEHAQTIGRTFNFDDFMTGIDFVRRIAKQALKINHHPDIDIRFDKVTLTLPAHDEGGITEKDFLLARKCDEVFARFLVA